MRTKPLKHFCIGGPIYGLNVPAEQYATHGIRLLRTTDIDADARLRPSDSAVYLDPVQVPSDSLLRTGDLLLSRSGTLGRALLVPQSNEGLTYAGYLVRFRSSPGTEPRYLAYCAKSQLLQDSIGADAIHSTIGNFNGERYANVRFPDWPLDEQRAIADYLDRETARIDALIAAKRRMIELLDERWVSTRDRAMLREHDPITGSGGVPSGWEIRNLGATITLQRGHDLPSDARVPGEVPVVSSGGITGWHDQAACEPPGVVTGRYGTIGTAYYLDEPYWPLNTTLYISHFRGNSHRWVLHLLAALPLSIDEEKSAVTGINRNVVGALRVPVPPVAEQREIAEALDAAHTRSRSAVDRIKTQLVLFREHRQTLITAAVTGNLATSVAA